MERIKAILNGVWTFCSYVFVPQRRTKDELGYKMEEGKE